MTLPRNDNAKEITKRKVMIVDDDKDTLDAFSRILSRSSYSVRCFRNPVKALEAFRKNPEGYRVIVVEVHMPGMTGFEFSRLIRKISSETKIILRSDFQVTKSEFKVVFPSSQVDDIIAKPTSEGLLKAVSRILDDTIKSDTTIERSGIGAGRDRKRVAFRFNNAPEF